METPKPAIILITADQLRKDALSCYGNRAVRTPALDGLAREGVRFERAYCPSPWCLPSRCSLLTGLFPHRSRAYSNFRDGRLDPAIPNLYTFLSRGGYSTAHVGKCHYAPVPYGQTQPDRTLPYEAFRDYYLSLGMDRLVLQDDKQVSVWFRDDYAAEMDAAGYLRAYRDAVWDPAYRKVFPFPGPAEWHPDAWVGRKAVDLVEGYSEEKPLFLWASFSGPHFPFDPPAEYLDRVDPERLGDGAYQEGEWDDECKAHHASFHGGGRIEGAGSAPGRACANYLPDYWRTLRRHYLANVALIDDQAGALLAAARRRFADNVLVLFTADHGEMLGNHRLWGKHNCAYEDVWNVPLLVRYPGERGGEASHAKVMLTDLFATCLAAAGVEAPGNDGIDLRELTRSGGHRHVFSEGDGFLAVSDGDLKYVRVRSGEQSYAELYDLRSDPHEFRNVIDAQEHARGLAELQTALLDRFMGALLR